MRKTIPMRVGDLWAEFVESNPAARRHLATARIPEVWAQLVGPAVAARTTQLRLERGVLYAHLDSSVVRNEIFMRREELKDAINNALGVRAVNVVIVK
jgi:predicted nucleic acid-binding Zn ribbon protein